MAERCWGIVIEGVPAPDTIKPLAICSAASDALLDIVRGLSSVFVGKYLEAREGLAGRPGSIDTSIDPFRVNESHGSQTVRVVATDYFGGMLYNKAYRSVSKLDVLLTSSATSVDLNRTGLDTAPATIVDPVAGSFNVVWIGSEAILVPLSSETAPGSGIYAGCTRGALMTDAQEHPVGTYVWDRIPYWTGRRVWLFDAMRERTPRCKLREAGIIQRGFTMDRGEIIVRISSHLSSLDKLSANLKPYKVEEAAWSDIRYINSLDFPTGAGLGGSFRSSYTGLNVRKKYRAGGALVTLPDGAWVQNGEHFQYFNGETSVRPNEYYYYSRNISNLLRSEAVIPSDSNDEIEIRPHFLLCVVNPDYQTWFQDGYLGERRRPAASPALGTSFGATAFFGATQDFEDLTTNADYKEVYKYHPVAIAAAMMLSTKSDVADPDEFDILHHNWSLDLRRHFSAASIAEIHECIKRNPTDQVEYFVLGKDGQGVRLLEEIRNLLQTYGYRLLVDKNGYLTIGKVGLIDVETWSAAGSNVVDAVASDLLQFTDGSGDTMARVIGKYGETPFYDGNTVEVSSQLEGQYPQVATVDENELSINANTIANLGPLRAQLESRAMLMDFQCPRLQVRVDGDTSADLGLGQWVNLQDLPLQKAWLFDSEGNRVSAISSQFDARWIGQVISRRYLISENAYEIGLIFPNSDLIRLRAPSARVSGAPQTVNTRIGIVTGSPDFGDPDGDISRFTVGDEVSIVSDSGAWVTTTPLSITGIGADYLAFGVNVETYNRGDNWVELAYLRTNSGNGYENTSVLSGIDRAYAFLGADNETLGSAGIDGDSYG